MHNHLPFFKSTVGKMFFIRELEKTITLHPSYFGPHMRDYLIHKLHDDVEGSCTGQFFIICVIDHEQISPGKIIPGRGDAEFTIHYKAIVYRPFRGETVDAVVTSVNKMGFFAEVGALQCFVSKQAIPSEIPFDETANPPQYSDGGEQVINKGAHVRMKLVGIRSDVGKMYATASIKEDYLGWVFAFLSAFDRLTTHLRSVL